ncbi:MAG: hypothetical protein IJD10_07830, partial [Clostridia bacterium]|nr:hypothetical protein [Clostridia bacterium]
MNGNTKHRPFSFPPLTLALFSAAAVIFSSLLGLVSMPEAMILSLMISGVSLAVLLSGSSPLLYLPVIAASPVIAWFLSGGSAVCTLLTLAGLPYGIALAFFGQGKAKRFTAVNAAAAAVTVSVIAGLLIAVYAGQGSLSLDAIQKQFPTFFDLLRKALKEAFAITIAGEQVAFVTDHHINTSLTLVIGLIPGIVGLIAVSVGYV